MESALPGRNPVDGNDGFDRRGLVVDVSDFADLLSTSRASPSDFL
ncbi:hypothetical protein [Noviherbaspirillum humi]|nr:hypothetical protein [Noviherbaspirillum humi]